MTTHQLLPLPDPLLSWERQRSRATAKQRRDRPAPLVLRSLPLAVTFYV